MQILALPLISIIFKNKLGSFETDCRWHQFDTKINDEKIGLLIVHIYFFQ